MARLTARERAELPDRAFAYVDSSGRRRLPIYDASHVRNALSRFNQVEFESEAAKERSRRRLLGAAQRFRIVPIGFIDSQIRSARDPADHRLPTGFVTMLFSDIEDSTGHLIRLGDAYADLVDQVRSGHRSAVAAVGGVTVEARADEYFAVFESPQAALVAGVAIQRFVGGIEADGEGVRIRVGVHAGYPTRRLDNYVGMAVHTAARITGAAHGGQIVLSNDTVTAMSNDVPDELELLALGRHRLRGIPGPPIELHRVRANGLVDTFPPLRTERVPGDP